MNAVSFPLDANGRIHTDDKVDAIEDAGRHILDSAPTPFFLYREDGSNFAVWNTAVNDKA